MGTFIIKQTATGQFRFNLKAGNNEIILTSESYTSKAACQKGVDAVIANSGDEAMYTKLKSTNNKYYFNLKASNGQVIGTSEMYETAAGRDKGIRSVTSNASGASILEE